MPQKPIKAPTTTAENSDQRMNIDQLKAYHPDCPARSTIYDRVCQNRIPVHEDERNCASSAHPGRTHKTQTISLDDITDEQINRLIEWDQQNNPHK